jgi:putative ABC transport system permease protein
MYFDLITNYLKAAKNHGYKHLSSSLLNTLGLAFGFLACILIMLFVRDELSFDKWLADNERLYKLEVVYTPPGRDEIAFARTPYPAIDALKVYFPGAFQEATRILAKDVVVSKDSSGLREEFHFVDGDFLKIFGLELLEGEGERLASRPDGILLSKSAALKYFGEDGAVGRSLTIDNDSVYVVLGVFSDTPQNSHFRPSFVAQLPNHGFTDPQKFNSWRQIYVHTYFKVRGAADVQAISDGLASFVDTEIPADNDWVPSERMRLELLPLTDIHLHSKSRLQLSSDLGDRAVVDTFILVAVLILLVSVVNFSSISLSQSMLRSKEISVRKVVGASSRDIATQFMLESLLISLLAMLLAMLGTYLVLPYYNEYLQKSLELGLAGNGLVFAWLAAGALAIGLLAGAYPAFVLSLFTPGKALRAASRTVAFARSATVVLQFSLAAGLMIATAVIYLQTNYASKFDAGFDKENKLQIAIPSNATFSAESFAQRALAINGVSRVGMSDDSLPSRNNRNITLQIPGAKDNELLVAERVAVDFDYFAVYEVPALSGRLFTADMASDQLALGEPDAAVNAGVVVNRKFVVTAGYASPDQAVGKTVTTEIDGRHVNATIVGVINDMHTRSTHFAIAPTMYFLEDRERLDYISLDVEPAFLGGVGNAVDTLWLELEPSTPIEKSLVARDFADLYRVEIKKANLFALFALLAGFMSCLGLYSLAAFTLERRMAEIALRKVLGATKPGLVGLMLKQFLIPVAIAIAIALPASLIFLTDWLKAFEYRVGLLDNAHVIAACVVVTVVIAILTVLNRTLDAASRRPAGVLKND